MSKVASSPARTGWRREVVLLVLGAMHFFNLFVFSRMRRRALLTFAPPPVLPDFCVVPPPPPLR